MTEASRSAYWLIAGLFIALLATTAAIYSVGVGGPWIFDDFINLQSLYEYRNKGWATLIDQYLMSPSGRLGRPVSMLTFIFSATTAGEYLPAWKWFNVGLHLVTGLLLFWLARRLFEDIGRWSPSAAAYAACVVAGLWLLHPLHVSTVLYTVQRMAILPVLFCVLGLALYLAGRRRLVEGRSGWLAILAALVVCWPLATFSKENGVLLGLYILLAEWILPRVENRAAQRKLYAMLAVVVILPGLLAAAYVLSKPSVLIGGYSIRDFTLLERLLTESRIVWEYVLWIFVPLQRFLGFMHDDIVVSTGLLTPITTLPAVCAWLLVVVAVPFLRWRQPVIAFGVALFLASHLLESTIIPLELAFEHRNYLGSFGLLLAATALLERTIQHGFLRKLLAGVLLAVFVAMLFARVQTWSDINRLYASMWLSHPQSPRMVATVAAQYGRNGEYQRALAVLDALDNPRLDSVRLYILCLRDNRLEDAMLDKTYEQAPSQLTDYLLGALFYTARQGLDGDCDYSAGRFVALTQRLLTKSNASRSRRYKVLIYRAHFQLRAGDLDSALVTLDDVAGIEPRSPIPLSLRTEWLANAGQKALAQQSYVRLQELLEGRDDIDFAERMRDLAEMLEAGVPKP